MSIVLTCCGKYVSDKDMLRWSIMRKTIFICEGVFDGDSLFDDSDSDAEEDYVIIMTHI